MFNVCPKCGVYSVEKIIEPEGPFAVCPHCGYRHGFLRLPLFVITGASGTGKSAVEETANGIAEWIHGKFCLSKF